MNNSKELEEVKKQRDDLLILIERILPFLPNIPCKELADIRHEIENALNWYTGDMEIRWRENYYNDLREEIKLAEDSLEVMGPKDQLDSKQLEEYETIERKIRDYKFLLSSSDIKK